MKSIKENMVIRKEREEAASYMRRELMSLRVNKKGINQTIIQKIREPNMYSKLLNLNSYKH